MKLREGSAVAVVGAGVAGVTAAYMLSEKYEITLFEKQDRIGGHTNTITVQDTHAGEVGIDTGFIVCNDRTYPTLHRFFEALSVPVRFADMSFSVQCERSNLTYGSRSLAAILCTPANFLKVDYYRLILDFPKFWKQANGWLEANPQNGMTVSEFVAEFGYSQSFLNNFLVPMGAAIWSSPDMKIEHFPVRFFLRFFKNHGMLSYADQPCWQTVIGGSHSYLKAFQENFTGKIVTEAGISGIVREEKGIRINFEEKEPLTFEHVVIATHADQALCMLGDADRLESDLLSNWVYQPNHAVLHTDVSFLPDVKSAWASWNYRRGTGDDAADPVSITYDLTRLQGLPTDTRYLVTLNPHRKIKEDSVIYEIEYTHPQYTVETEAAQERLPELRNRNSTTFAGSYFGFGFHEDACKAGYEAALSLGGSL